ncbi:serine/threonine-protein kinase [Umezawaea sp. Da 62-37]|uniref:serine/threonine-protein kinase n=1 Tax=Umezawaea sp. Da 62-37 TaxID=3075927 RepID=UPI0028F70CE4|nr:serine/threonine-protein kinase [Umezawaea sp. Da 62-37]WNV90804.1 serine/threonine-protein kinase [Umezawaea sp. Da 62-37]
MTDDGRLVAGRYRLGSRIGSGAMGIVWQAHDQRLHRIVAVKQLLLQPGLAASETDEAKRRAMREGRIAARLQHPHAIAVYDVAEDDGQPWLVMEYLPSKSLSTVLSERGTLPPREVAAIGQQVASALTAAHNAGIVHRDIKPGNILLGDEGVVKITDFGISRATGDVTVTATGMLAGTPAYLAPEVAKGYDPGSPSDVFSLGSTLYAAIEGAPPFGLNENTIALLHQVASGNVNPPKQAGPLTALLMRLLRPEPEDRPTMAEAREALAAVAAGRAAPEFPMAVQQVSQPSWRGAPLSTDSATRAMSPQAAVSTPPPGTRIDIRPGPPQQQQQQPHYQQQQPSYQQQQPRPAAAPHRTAPPRQSSSMSSVKDAASKRSTIITALAIVAAAVVGIMLASFLSGGDDPGQKVAEPGSSASATQPPGESGEEEAPPAGDGSKLPPQVTGEPDQATQEKMIRDYFALLPGDPNSAFNWLTDKMKGAGKGKSTYLDFWKTIKTVKIDEVKLNAPYAYEVDVAYTKKDGTNSKERKLIGLEWSGSQLLIDKETPLGNY